jgi:septal ring factor EnvC (AmiA/AmiB activator)
MEATPEERIAQLEAARTELVRKKTELERKLSDLSARRQGLQGSKSEGNR